MTVKIYVSKDTTTGKEWAPDYVQEVANLEWMFKKAWIEFHHLPTLYMLIANLRHPSADLVIITERGLGVLELKHSDGEISIGTDGSWYSGGKRINAGTQINPRRQVQKYAEEIRQILLPWLLPPPLKKDPSLWNELKFQTGVCFTNPAVNIEAISGLVANKRPQPILPWESDFIVMEKSGFTAWVRELRFQANLGPSKFQPVRLQPMTMLSIATRALGAIEWKEEIAAMPTGEPYGYLILDDEEGRQMYNLTKDETLIGRDPDCDIVIPERYLKVSKIHCRITRGISNIEISDLSANGTYVEGGSVPTGEGSGSVTLSHGKHLLLGGQLAGEKICQLIFELREKTRLKPPSTDISSK